jgi:YHS domain-containing protein
MLRFLILEVVLPILLFTLVRAVIRSIFQGFKNAAAPPPQAAPRRAPAVQSGGELKKDPVCGTYVSTAVSVTKKIDGELVHFCSKECRDRYHAA